MLYYAVIYMLDGQIHLKPFETRKDADACRKAVMETKWGPMVKDTKIVKKDPEKETFVKKRGMWIM